MCQRLAHLHAPPPPQELRRGADPAAIFSIALSKNCDWLAVSSGKGTVHVFALAEAVAAVANPRSILAVVRGLVPAIPLPKYFTSEWSFAQFRIQEDSCRYVICDLV